MANTLTFTAPIAVAQVKIVKVMRLTEIDDIAKRLVAEVLLSGLTGILFPPSPWRLEITNGGCDALAAHPAPAKTTDSVIAVRLTGAGVATAYDTVLAAFVAGGADKFGAMLAALKGISGTVTGSGTALDGTIVPILPAGAVT
jgi:hypothetical protein